jgi:glycosyltransferase involved in cell wall biosynthesis
MGRIDLVEPLASAHPSRGGDAVRVSILTTDYFKSLAEVQGKDRLVHGGAEKYLVELTRLLTDMGHTVTVYAGYPPAGSSPRDIYKTYGNMNFVLMRHSENLDHNCYPQLNQWFNEMAAGSDLYIYFSPFLCWPHAHRNSISVCHGIYWDWVHNPVRTWNDSDLAQFWKQNLYGFTAPDVCVSVDTNSKNVIRAIVPGEQRKMVVIPNFVDTDKFIPGKKTWPETRVLLPRRMHILRGQNAFIRLAVDFADDPNYKFIACGQAINEQEETMMTDKIHNTHKNLLQTWVPMEDMPELYQKSDISVIPTIACEGQSLGTLESMSSGLPIIASNVGGLTDLVIDGYNGLVWDPDYDSLTEKIRELEDPSLREKFGRHGREMAVDSFDIRKWRRSWTDLIKEMI